jgi:hypothetical protein
MKNEEDEIGKKSYYFRMIYRIQIKNYKNNIFNQFFLFQHFFYQRNFL